MIYSRCFLLLGWHKYDSHTHPVYLVLAVYKLQ